MKKRKAINLSVKLITGFCLLGILICAVGTFFGYNNYRKNITKQYNDTAYMVADTALSYFTEEELAEYSRLARQGEEYEGQFAEIIASERYQEISGRLEDLRSSMQANDIFVAYIDTDILKEYNGSKEGWSPIRYAFDCYHIQEESYRLGDVGPCNPDFIEDAVKFMETGERPGNYFISKSDYGYNTTAVLPVVIGGSTAAVINVEFPMSTLQSVLRDYVKSAVIATVVVVVLFIAVYQFYLYCRMVVPIKLMSEEAVNFLKEQTKVSERLGTIRTGDEIQKLSESILDMEIGINEYIKNLTAVTAEKERISTELNVATQIQADMLPSIFPAFPGRKEFDIYATMNPAKEVGGDFYDFFLIDDNHLAMVMADVSGKGVPAALFMVIAKTLIKNRTQMGGNPSEILEDVNGQLCEGNGEGLFVTVWLAILDITTGKGVAANAGHEHPVVKRAGGEYELVVYRHSPAVAAMEGIPFREHEFELYPGDCLYIYTDGVPEATNDKDELYGTERMLEVLNRNKDASMEHLLHSVKEDIDRFVGEAPQFDDVTMMGLNYIGIRSE